MTKSSIPPELEEAYRKWEEYEAKHGPFPEPPSYYSAMAAQGDRTAAYYLMESFVRRHSNATDESTVFVIDALKSYIEAVSKYKPTSSKTHSRLRGEAPPDAGELLKKAFAQTGKIDWNEERTI